MRVDDKGDIAETEISQWKWGMHRAQKQDVAERVRQLSIGIETNVQSLEVGAIRDAGRDGVRHEDANGVERTHGKVYVEMSQIGEVVHERSPAIDVGLNHDTFKCREG